MISEGQIIAGFLALWGVVTALAATIYRDMRARIDNLEKDNEELQDKLDANETRTREMSQAALAAMERQGAELATIRDLLKAGRDGRGQH